MLKPMFMMFDRYMYMYKRNWGLAHFLEKYFWQQDSRKPYEIFSEYDVLQGNDVVAFLSLSLSS